MNGLPVLNYPYFNMNKKKSLQKLEDKSSTGQKFDFFGDSNLCPLELMS